jgi:uncharacterized membrane protein
VTRGANRQDSYTWPLVAIALVILAQVFVPGRDRVGPPLLVPLVELGVFLVLAAIAAKPGPVPRGARPFELTLIAVLVAANAVGAARLVALVLDNGEVQGEHLTATRLLVAGALVIIANVVTFGILYWQLDGGGPAGRIAVPAPAPDFQFPQMVDPGPSNAQWRPTFLDHLYVAYTDIVAFSPTDAMPLTHRAKALMALQSLISIGVGAVVLARVINILPG